MSYMVYSACYRCLGQVLLTPAHNKRQSNLPRKTINLDGSSIVFHHQQLNRRSASGTNRQAGLSENLADNNKPNDLPTATRSIGAWYGSWTKSRRSRSAMHTEQKKAHKTPWQTHPIPSKVEIVTATVTTTATATATATTEEQTVAVGSVAS